MEVVACRHMKTEQTCWMQGRGWGGSRPGVLSNQAQLVLIFGSPALLKEHERIKEIKQAYPLAYLLGCSTSGEIYDTQVLDDSLVVTAIQFETSMLQRAYSRIVEHADSQAVGK